MNKFKRPRPLQPWQLKLQRLLLSGQVKEHGGLYRLDVRHLATCAIHRGRPCDCNVYVALDGVHSCKP